MATKPDATTLSPLEEEAIARKQAEVLAVSTATADKLVNLFDESATTFKRAREIARGIDKGATLDLIASILSDHRARKAYPDVSEEDIQLYATTTPGKGGVMVPKASVSAYDGAWRSVQRAGLTPTEDTVNIAFKVLSKGRTADPRKALEKRLFAALEAEEIDTEQATSLYVTGSREILTGRLATEARPRVGGHNKKAPIVDLTDVAERIEDSEVPMSAEVAAHTIRAIAGRVWSDDDKAEIAMALTEALETLAAEPVEV